jgi:RsiW-degrading membrane proteinase PrsW (M82 family)
MVMIIALFVAFAIPCLYLYFGIYQRDYFQMGNRNLMMVSFVWGIVAYLLSYLANTATRSLGWVDTVNMVRFVAPPVEEILKSAILLYLISLSTFTYFVDGAIYGFTVGIGFAVVENFEYVSGHPEAALTLALARVFSTNLIHATASGSIAIALGLSRFEKSTSFKRWAYLLGSILVSMALHLAFNNLVTRNVPLLLPIVVGLLGAGLIVLIMRRGLNNQKEWVSGQLSIEQSVTTGEAAIVNQFERVDQILVPFGERFGAQKTALAREILLAQAQIGINKEKAIKHQDEKLRAAAEKQVAELRQTMNENRKRLGTYCMLYLRNVFPEEGSPLWGRLEEIIKARGTTDKNLAGTGLWTSLDQKVKSADAAPKTEGR